MKKTIKSWGLQALLARKLGMSRTHINGIFQGQHRATAKLAERMEAEFICLGIPLSRWDLLYGVKEGQSLADYLKQKQAVEG